MLTLKSALITTWEIFWRILLFLIEWAILLSVFFVPLGSKITHLQKAFPLGMQLYADFITAITILTATWAMTRFIDHRPLKTIGLSLSHFFRDMLTGLAVGVAWLALSFAIAWIFGWASPVTPVGFSWTVLILSSISMLFNVIAQEFLLCGFIFQTIRTKSNTIIAVVISAILFASYHAGAFKGDWPPILNVFGAGILFCFAYIITNNLWFPIFIHFTWDVLLGPVIGLTESGKNLGGGWKMIELKGPSLFTGGSFGLEGGLIVTLTVSLIIILIYYFRNSLCHSREKPVPTRPAGMHSFL
jgi:hypothetical protein